MGKKIRRWSNAGEWVDVIDDADYAPEPATGDSITTIEGDIATLEDEMTTIEGDITAIEDDLTYLKTGVGPWVDIDIDVDYELASETTSHGGFGWGPPQIRKEGKFCRMRGFICSDTKSTSSNSWIAHIPKEFAPTGRVMLGCESGGLVSNAVYTNTQRVDVNMDGTIRTYSTPNIDGWTATPDDWYVSLHKRFYRGGGAMHNAVPATTTSGMWIGGGGEGWEHYQVDWPWVTNFIAQGDEYAFDDLIRNGAVSQNIFDFLPSWVTDGYRTRIMSALTNAGNVRVDWQNDGDLYCTSEGVFSNGWLTLGGMEHVFLSGRGIYSWTAPSFENSYGNYGSVYETGGYVKIGDVVWLKGLVNASTASDIGSTIFTLPVGYRPPYNMRFNTASSAGLKGGGTIDIGTDGTVKSIKTFNVDGNGWVSLDNAISFSVTA